VDLEKLLKEPGETKPSLETLVRTGKVPDTLEPKEFLEFIAKNSVLFQDISTYPSVTSRSEDKYTDFIREQACGLALDHGLTQFVKSVQYILRRRAESWKSLEIEQRKIKDIGFHLIADASFNRSVAYFAPDHHSVYTNCLFSHFFNFDKLRGLILHELGHVLFTNDAGWDYLVRKKGISHRFINLVEDRRIERILFEIFPASRDMIIAVHKKFFNKPVFHPFEICSYHLCFLSTDLYRPLTGFNSETDDPVEWAKSLWDKLGTAPSFQDSDGFAAPPDKEKTPWEPEPKTKKFIYDYVEIVSDIVHEDSFQGVVDTLPELWELVAKHAGVNLDALEELLRKAGKYAGEGGRRDRSERPVPGGLVPIDDQDALREAKEESAQKVSKGRTGGGGVGGPPGKASTLHSSAVNLIELGSVKIQFGFDPEKDGVSSELVIYPDEVQKGRALAKRFARYLSRKMAHLVSLFQKEYTSSGGRLDMRRVVGARVGTVKDGTIFRTENETRVRSPFLSYDVLLDGSGSMGVHGVSAGAVRIASFLYALKEYLDLDVRLFVTSTYRIVQIDNVEQLQHFAPHAGSEGFATYAMIPRKANLLFGITDGDFVDPTDFAFLRVLKDAKVLSLGVYASANLQALEEVKQNLTAFTRYRVAPDPSDLMPDIQRFFLTEVVNQMKVNSSFFASRHNSQLWPLLQSAGIVPEHLSEKELEQKFRTLRTERKQRHGKRVTSSVFAPSV